MGLLDSILGNLTGGGGAGAQTRGSATSPLVKALMMLLAAKAYQHYTSRPQGGPGQASGGPSGGLGGLLPGGGSMNTPTGGMNAPTGGGFSDGLYPPGSQPGTRPGMGGLNMGGMGGGMGGPGMGGQGMGGQGVGGGMGGNLGGLLSGGLGGLLGGLVSGGGLNSIVNHFQQNGFGDQIQSWVGHGQNQRLAPDQLMQALGPDTVNELEQQTGMPRDQVLSELSQELPDAVDQFTPDGRLPTEQEVSSRWV